MSDPDPRPLAGVAWLRAPASRKVLAALEADGHPARFVGGCVRDALLGLPDQGRDLDLATSERPERVMALLEAAGIRAIPTGLAHGTVSAVVDGRRFEITTLRRDLACDGRHAEVAFTDDFEADAARRDFTINAMGCDGDGRLCDPFGGRADLAAGRVRFVGKAAQRIEEDYLRILRFFRFYARHGRPPPDAEALAACAAGRQRIRQLSGERVQAELLALLDAPDPLPSLGLMVEAGVADEVFGGPVALARLAALLALAPEPDALLRLGALLRPPPAGPDAAARLARRWRLSKRAAERLEAMTTHELPPLQASPAERRRAVYRLGKERYLDLVQLAAADAPDGAAPSLDAARRLATTWQPPQLPVGGDDLLALGAEEGPALGRALAEVERWWLEHDFAPDRDACLARARALLARAPAP